MKKSIFAVCDLDSSYACNLMDYLNEKRSTPFEVQAFTNVESLKEFAAEQEIEILLISTRAMCNEIRELPISRVVILSEGEQFQETDLEYPFVYKYQSSDQLISEVMEYYAGTNPSTYLFTGTVSTKLIGVYIISFAEVFLTAKRSGGDLLLIISNTASCIRQKHETLQEIETCLSGKVMEQNIMSLVPVLILAYVKISSPEFLDGMYGNLTGTAVMTACFIVYVIAYLWGRRIVRIEV